MIVVHNQNVFEFSLSTGRKGGEEEKQTQSTNGFIITSQNSTLQFDTLEHFRVVLPKNYKKKKKIIDCN